MLLIADTGGLRSQLGRAVRTLLAIFMMGFLTETYSDHEERTKRLVAPCRWVDSTGSPIAGSQLELAVRRRHETSLLGLATAESN